MYVFHSVTTSLITGCLLYTLFYQSNSTPKYQKVCEQMSLLTNYIFLTQIKNNKPDFDILMNKHGNI